MKAPRDMAAIAQEFGIETDAKALPGMMTPDLLLSGAAFMVTNLWPGGVSGIPCASGRLTTWSGQGPGEALAEQDGELSLGHGPLPGWHPPLPLGPVQDEIEQLQRGLIGGEMAPGADGAAQLGV